MDIPTDTVAPPTRPSTRHEYWCHQCATEITPMMVPDPMCPTCQSEFVEKIEEDNDPRTFAETHEHGDEEGDEAREPVSLEDLFHLFHALNAPGMPQQQRQQGQEQQELSGSSLGLPFFFDTGMSRFGTGSEPTDLQTQNQAQTESTAGAGASGVGGAGVDGEDVEMTDATQDQETRPSRVPSVSLAALLESMVQLQYGIQGAQNGFGGLGRLFNMVGNPGDYVFGQGGLDDVITQMMELQSRQNGPVGASDEVINSIPIHKLTEEELDAKTECSVCKDEFNSQDVSLQLGCNHIFHEDCIKPWLKTNGSCPTCRFSLVPESQDDQRPQGTSSARTDTAATVSSTNDDTSRRDSGPSMPPSEPAD